MPTGIRADKSLTRYVPRRDETEPVEHWWDHVVEVWQVFRPAWWPIFITLALCFLVIGVGQIRDLLAAMPLDYSHGVIHDGEAGISGRFWTSFIACTVYAFIAWVFIRGLLSIRFPYTPCPYDPPDWHVVLRVFASRFLAIALPVSCAVSYYSLGMPREGLAYNILAVILFILFTLSRRFIHDWIDDQLEHEGVEEEFTVNDESPNREKVQAQKDARKRELISELPSFQAKFKIQLTNLAKGTGRIARLAGDEFREADLFDATMPENFAPQIRKILIGIMVFHLIASVLFLAYPVRLPQAIGAVAIIFLGAAGWLSFGVLMFSYFPRFTRLPSAFLLFMLWLAFASQFNDNHKVDRLEASETPSVNAPQIDGYLQTWLSARIDQLPTSEADEEFPILLIAAEGGGARAAYWTGTILSELQTAKPASGLDPQDHILMISGVSGGAVGTATYGAALAEGDGDTKVIYDSIRGFLKLDFLSPTTAGTLYHDFFTDMLPFPVAFADRAKWLERSWVKGWQKISPNSDAFGEDFRALWDEDKGRLSLGSLGAVPLLVYNTTSARTGSTWTVAPVRFADQRGCDSRDFVDLLEPDGRGMSLATAAHLSARFTGISPAGRIDLKGYEDCQEGSFDRFVDGAYFENSGADIATTLTRRLRPAIRSFCDFGRVCDPDRMPIVPVAIVAERGPSSNPPRMSHESGSVLMTVANTRSARGQDSLKRFEEVVGQPLEKIELALAWDRAEEGLHCSLHIDFEGKRPDENDNSALRRVPLGWALSHAAVDHMCRERLRDDVLDDIILRLEGK